MYIKKPFEYHPPVDTYNDEPSLVHSSFQAESDINNIMAKWVSTQSISHLSKISPKFGDFSETTDYLSAALSVIDANEAFMALPAKVRKRFDNSPIEFLDFATNPQNLDELIELGLATKKEADKSESDLSVAGAPASNSSDSG